MPPLARSLGGLGLCLWAMLALAGCGQRADSSDIAIIGYAGRQPGSFTKVRAVVAARDNLLFAIDRSGRVQRFNYETGAYIDHWWLQDWENGTPTGITLDLDGESFWVADTHYQRILRYDLEGNLVDSWGERGTGPGQLIFPTDVCPDPDGRTVWVSEYGRRNRIMHFTRDGRFIKEWGTEAMENEALYRPMAIAVREDAGGGSLLVVADAGNHRILTFDRDGNLRGAWGEPGSAPGRLDSPYDIAFAPDGTLYVCEYANSRISHYTVDGRFLGHWGGPGFDPGQVFGVWGVATNTEGTLFVADMNNGRIQVLRRPQRFFLKAVDAS